VPTIDTTVGKALLCALGEDVCILTAPFPTIQHAGPLAIASLAMTVSAASAQDVSFGQRLFQEKADCQFCHGPEGDGHGDPRSPGKASDLHKTMLAREQLIEVVTCGRVGTEMPYFDKYAYEERKCRGLSEADVGKDMPPVPHSNSLTQREIAAVVEYILARFVGK
jgi:mono/diheme cytochrome c family protein